MAKRYQIVKADSSFDLELKVNKIMIRGGWVPTGGVCFYEASGFSLREVWTQAMVRVDDGS